jgi:hypothetical protein
MESVEKLAAALLAAAIREGRQDYVDALNSLIPLTSLLTELKDNLDTFDDQWKKRLLRNEYSAEEVSHLFTHELLSSEKYVEFLAEATIHVQEKSTKYIMVKQMIGAGLYAAALKSVEALDDVADLAHWLHTRRTRFTKSATKTYQHMIGNEVAFSRIGAKLFDRLDIEVPDDFDGTYLNKKLQWSMSKLSACVDWVSEIAPAPIAEVDQRGHLTIHNASLISAFRGERERIQSKGEWHQQVFPRFVPVIAGEAASKALFARGEIMIQPEFEVTRVDVHRGPETQVSHGFKTMHPAVDAEDIALAMTFLSYETVAELRLPGDQRNIFLLPENSDIPLSKDSYCPEDLRVAMRYHRPEFLRARYEGNTYDIRQAGIDTRLYLRGLPFRGSDHSMLDLTNQLATDSNLLNALNSPQELAHLREAFAPRHGKGMAGSVTISEPENGREMSDQVRESVDAIERIANKLGFQPTIKFLGHESFLTAVANELTRRQIGVTNFNWVEFKDNSRSNMTPTQTRLSARLGVLSGNKFREVSTEELMTKVARLKDPHDKTIVCGILDRLGVPEIARLANTPAKREFVIQNFDVSAHFKDLPKEIRVAIGGKKLETDLGM